MSNELISRDAIIKKQLEIAKHCHKFSLRLMCIGYLESVLGSAPTVPAEAVVHCGECKRFWGCSWSGSGNDYCSRGKRRESEVGK